ncbi:tRNA (adenosine(37)-N6)-dimethylallyltransferase MiaA [Myroides odoratimimus]|uniref:tRNA (adenosine(37)-N6)-dimethylallyltransferase MiaA n=1 Tax=Myroides odoratimimus TaxID=76832 RepID=UPI002578E886|nr:tRNA (adenosine(37)-N6)-dimethylallyltransferase MiaA [Myroides odoratimimus]MDM1464769.1 tRNA (adenosine(37)-N6)-dimethylallyltransferase MiaA [Myroides odoratimimus]MDM1474756.1 tRNA (adenosine(37)-N6)-dimethylallyltransferase MiaA [Myroides odoratimimus]MDM1484545.1 tRNA (adenosine(37)-N6)-dimethylallyltransferase MiaA [Myroides odoratimimus]MDM1525665.1 tRNA (adenosine(37)-N6)-dimethylallyltransferase MiaA [Myroides odoratimimus]MDM1680335.1 tRNA (adenosine(37)-N6)-dimethylallyltransfer
MSTKNNNYLIVVIGPTAIGKTALGIKLAQHFNTNIISCDSRQFYKEMAIGTAVPSKEELAAAPHHFIQNISIHDTYSVGDFEREALAKLDELFTDNPVQVMVGGSGLFVNAILNGLDDFPDVDPSVREQLNQDLAEKGLPYLQNMLKELDPIHYEKVAIDNPQRVTRALEICIGTGKPYSSFLNIKQHTRNFTPIVIGLEADREKMYERINKRVDIMLDNGLLKEAQDLYPYRDNNALQTVGYRELFAYFDNEFTLEFAIEEIKKNTRRFAKRQITWFKRTPDVMWFDYLTAPEQILKAVEDKIQF